MRFQVSVVVGVLLIVSVMAISTVSTVLSVARLNARQSAEGLFEAVSAAARERTVSLLQPAVHMATVAAYMTDIDIAVVGSGMSHPALSVFTQMLTAQPELYSSYIGYADGSFFMVINGRQGRSVLDAHGAPGGTEFIVRAISGVGEDRTQQWSFLAADGEVLGGRTEDEVGYDPRLRPWYADATAHPEPILSEPYVFDSLRQPGITAAHRIPGGAGVVGVDMTISLLTSFVSAQRISENGGIALFAGDLAPIAASPGATAFLDSLESEGGGIDEVFSSPGLMTVGDRLVSHERWDIAVNRDLVILSTAPIADFMEGARLMQRRILLISGIILLVTVPFVVFWARRLSRALKELSTDAERVGAMDFSGQLTVQTPIHEFHQLAGAFEVMKSTIATRTRELEVALVKLEMLVDMGIAMSAEFDINRLSEMILSGAKELTNADGGSLYLASKDRKQLDFMIVLNDSLGFKQGGTSEVPVAMRPVPLYDAEGNENHRNVVTHIFHTARTENIADAYEVGTYDFSGTREFDAENGYRSVSFLTVPLKPRGGGEVLGAFQLINAIDPETGEIRPFPPNLQSFVEALSSAAAVAVQNWKLMERQKRLFDDLVKFIAGAIDAKSPYTARHSARVPEVAAILAEKARASTTGPFADFDMTADEQREFAIGSWLHDCGKITTPEYVVDKATKLETIYNRLHEIRTRFEVLLRDAHIHRLESLAAGADPAQADAAFEETRRQLEEDFAFVADCNVGSEYMEEESLERLRRIAEIRWQRHFDNRIGLSWGERRRLESLGLLEDHNLPAPERLIEDRPEQVVLRENWTRESYDAFGFRFTVPEHLYNRGELYNLSVRTGTLTPEERFKIDEHVAQTIVMLERLPFPEELRRVPEYAGSHHEVLDGTGYPRGLGADQLSIPARIMAIADILDAITSTDRPYKRDKTLSEAIEILFGMKKAGKIDADLFDLFLTSGAYLEYAQRFLSPAQIDEVDVSAYL